jgi:ABC-type antimicrobial peptide transport system permease subunit
MWNDPAGSGQAVEPWQVFAKTFYDAMTADQKGNWISLAIITMLVAIGVLNTVLMTVLERTREYGLMRAIGTSPWMVFRLVLTEVSLMAVMSVAVGCVIATGVNYWLSINGVAMPVAIDFGGMTFSHAYTEINVRSYVIPLLCVFLSAIFISVFPAMKAARTQPAAAMRYH